MPKNLGFGGGPLSAAEQRIKSRREAALSLLSSAVAEPAAGLAGLWGAATGGLD